MNKVRKNIGAENAYRLGFFGQQVGIAILDTGIVTHVDFMKPEQRIVFYKNFVGRKKEIYDEHGHGTHIAGIAAGSGYASNGKYMGVAPMAHLIILKVLDDEGNGEVSALCQAIDWILNNHLRYKIKILNISVGASRSMTEIEKEQLIQKVEKAWDIGLIVIAAAGNNGPESGSITIPGTSKKIITVGAAPESIEMIGQDDAYRYSGRGPTEECICKPDLLAPGTQIMACANFQKNSYQKKSGTSMAVPIVAGGIALILNAHPKMTNKEIKLYLRKNAKSLHLPRNYQGWGMFYITEQEMTDI